MAKKKKEPPIDGIGRKPEELLVQKSRPLFALWQSDLTLQEFKILDTYLARIDSHHPEKRVVVFEKGELEQLLGVSKINLPQLKDRLKHLMGNVVEVGIPKQPKSMHLITLFEEAIATQDETTGLWEVRLECTQKAMKYCFNVEKLGYLRYKLKGIVSLQSRYSYILFLYLESNRRFKTWTVNLDELKTHLKCTGEYYNEFKTFNQKVLQRCTKEILEKTDQRFTYEPIKKGRKVVALRFTLETLEDIIPEIDELPGQISAEELEESEVIPYQALEDLDFTHEQKKLLVVTMYELIPYQGDRLLREQQIYQYLYKLKLKMRTSDKKNPIKHKHSWMLTVIENDIAKKQGG